MNKKYEQLIADYLGGSLDEASKLQLKELLARGEIDPIAFRTVKQFYEELDTLATPEPSAGMSRNFYAMLEASKEKEAERSSLTGLKHTLRQFVSLFTLPRLAYAFVLLFIGALIGDQFGTNEDRLEELTAEMQNMREIMMVAMLEGSSPTDRLRAVNISTELPVADEKAIQALLFTLNNDKSVNVRVQTVEALIRWGDNEMVREGLVNSIAYQESETVIVALADAMVVLGVRNSVDKFEELLKNRDLDINVKQKLQTSIAALL